MRQLVHKILPVDEKEIIEAMYLIVERYNIYFRMKILIEPSCATPLAAIIKNKELFKNKTVVIILSGGNVDICDTK
jgi:threonine dehydratase